MVRLYIIHVCIMLAILKSETENYLKKQLEKMESNPEKIDKNEITKEQNIAADKNCSSYRIAKYSFRKCGNSKTSKYIS